MGGTVHILMQMVVVCYILSLTQSTNVMTLLIFGKRETITSVKKSIKLFKVEDYYFFHYRNVIDFMKVNNLKEVKVEIETIEFN
jgi:hypothetical protein